MARRIVWVHGRGFKPGREVLERSWVAAVAHGLERDRGAATRMRFEACPRSFAYYGDFSNALLARRGARYDREADVADRQRALEALAQLDAQELVGASAERRFARTPGSGTLAAALAHLVAHPLAWLGLGSRAIAHFAPDLCEYWNFGSDFGSRVRWTLTEILEPALFAGDDLLLVSHSLGTLIAYDNLWKLSHYAEHRDVFETGHPVARWITLGSPLGDPTVQKHLKGRDANGPRRYPANVREWINVSAIGDYVAHDRALRDDYAAMLAFGSIESIEDHRIYNLAVRHGRSNPHHAVGYLIHPSVVRAIADWLERGEPRA